MRLPLRTEEEYRCKKKSVDLRLRLTESKNQHVGRNLADSKEVNRLRKPIVVNAETQQAWGRW